MSVTWELERGKIYRRVDIHETYGGRRQGGISPSRVSPNVMLFTDPVTGHRHGYFDGWGEDDGRFYYTGEGQNGDQKMVQGNLTVLKHVEEGRALRLFRIVSTGQAEYVGEFTLDPENPWRDVDAPDTNGEEIRKVIMFCLVPKDALPPSGPFVPYTPAPKPIVDEVEVEQHNSTERLFIDPAREPYESERREAALVQAYKGHLERRGHSVKRNRIRPAGETKPLFTDLYDVTENLLIEAKGSVTREAIRMAIGQLFDYERHLIESPALAILVPTSPRPDLVELCTRHGITVIWQDGDSFRKVNA